MVGRGVVSSGKSVLLYLHDDDEKKGPNGHLIHTYIFVYIAAYP